MISGNPAAWMRQQGATMGGYGSGAHATRPGSDGLLRLDLRRLFRAGLVAPGSGQLRAMTERWTCRGEPSAVIEVWWDDRQPDRLTLRYQLRAGWEDLWQEIAEFVPIGTTPGRFGGVRRWGSCPRCGRRVAVLYSVGGHFQCRTCGRVAYSSTREAAWRRVHRRAQPLYARLGVPEATLSQQGAHVPRPAGMHRTTYRRLIAELDALAQQADQVYLEDLQTLATRLERRERARDAHRRSGEGEESEDPRGWGWGRARQP
jgi:uncharacterized Zn finger protein (UPF0148 family)